MHNIDKPIQILLIEDETYDVRRVENTVRHFKEKINIRDIVSNGKNALQTLEAAPQNYDVIIMDYQIAGGISGEALIRRIKEVNPLFQIIVVTKMTVNITDFEFANRLMEAGAIWYCTKYPGDIEDYIYQPTDFILSILNAYEKKRLALAKAQSDKKLNRSVDEVLQNKPLVGNSESINALREKIRQCAESDATVLLNGPSGTGKELVATQIHYQSARRLEKFVPINCGSLPADLIESELFGYEKGAFTGAITAKRGLFEIADRGTIFLDEIAELPLSAQVKLLRVIQDGEIDKIGRVERKKVDVRIVAATNKRLEEMVRQGQFREDLYYRLNVVFIKIPALAERHDDIAILVEHFLKQFSAKMSLETPQIDKEAMQLLRQHDWPGNVRELQNVVQRILFARDKLIKPDLIRNSLGMLSNPNQANPMQWAPDNIMPLKEMEREMRLAYFQFVRKHTTSDADAARKLGLAPSNYHRMCKELGLK